MKNRVNLMTVLLVALALASLLAKVKGIDHGSQLFGFSSGG